MSYYMTHPDYKERLLFRQKQLIKCNCGSILMYCNYKTHTKSKIHFKKMNENNINEIIPTNNKINLIEKSLKLKIEIIVSK